IPYIMGGDPDLATTVRLLEVLVAAGADMIEVGVPFSDPLADGAVIQAAGQRALRNGCTVEKLFQALQSVALQLPVPVVCMIYYNLIYQRGIERFLEAAAEAGVSGLIIPDLPPDDSAELQQLAPRYGIALNYLVAPTSTGERIVKAAEASTGFVYAVSLKGVTGARQSLPPELPKFIQTVKAATPKPVAVGFGIATPEQARMVAGLADGVIVGSAVVKAAAEGPDLQQVKGLVSDIKSAMKL
ncbi:MAG TPA: tryptophan synthase subunit alpha, partial [Bacillota bacterium]|nr:tryptophan synthase subunit alpha [Bacillota bacterium]